MLLFRLASEYTFTESNVIELTDVCCAEHVIQQKKFFSKTLQRLSDVKSLMIFISFLFPKCSIYDSV